MKIGFMGVGNLATSIISGMVKSSYTSKEILCYDINTVLLQEKCDFLNTTMCESPQQLIAKSEIVILLMKPHSIKAALYQLKDDIKDNGTQLISCAAGKSIEYLEEALGFKAPIVRVMPNINAAVGQSMTAICHNDKASQQFILEAQKCFSSVGETIFLEEGYFSIFAAIAGCSPAFTYMYIDSLAKAAHKAGLNKNDAIKIAAQAVMGSAKMLLESGEHPLALTDKVCSPGGATIEGVCVLDDCGFQSAVVKAVDASYMKDKKL